MTTRRAFLKGATNAVAATAITSPIGYMLAHATDLPEEFEKPENFLDTHATMDEFAVENLMEEYQITSEEDATKLRNQIITELTVATATGAALGSTARSLTDEFFPKQGEENSKIRLATEAANNTIIPAVTANVITDHSETPLSLIELIHQSALTKPDNLETKFGLERNHAESFAEKHSERIISFFYTSALLTPVGQQIIATHKQSNGTEEPTID